MEFISNFYFAIVGIVRGLLILLKSLAEYQLIWGFLLGFFFSTLIYGFLVTEKVQHVPVMLFHDTHTSFRKIHNKEHHEVHEEIFHRFGKDVNRVKFMFIVDALLFLALILFVFLRLH